MLIAPLKIYIFALAFAFHAHKFQPFCASCLLYLHRPVIWKPSIPAYGWAFIDLSPSYRSFAKNMVDIVWLILLFCKRLSACHLMSVKFCGSSSFLIALGLCFRQNFSPLCVKFPHFERQPFLLTAISVIFVIFYYLSVITENYHRQNLLVS